MENCQTLKKATVLYVYAMTCDTNFAPCIDEGWLTLACCKGGKKGGMRRSAGEELLKGHEVWVLGLRAKCLDARQAYQPVYLARLDKNALPMTEYYRAGGLSAGRADGVYEVNETGGLAPAHGNPHQYSEEAMERDRNGTYVLTSHHFIYWGNEDIETDKHIVSEMKQYFPEIFEKITRHSRGYLVDRNIPEFSVQAEKWFGAEQIKIFGHSINERFIPAVDDEDEEETATCLHCAKGTRG